MEEKRKNVRMELPLEVIYTLLGLKGLKRDTKSRDISVSGVSLFLDKGIKVNEHLALNIFLPGEAEPVFTESRIVWIREFSERNLAGLEFTQISRFDHSRLTQWIYTQKQKELSKGLEKKVISLKEVEIVDKEELLELLVKSSEEIEQGLKIIDKNVELDRDTERIDLLGLESTGGLVIIEVAPQADESILLLAFRHLDWILRNVEILKKLYPYEIDFSQSPKIFLVTASFSDSFKRQLLHLKPLNVQTIEYKCFLTSNSEKSLWLNKSKKSEEAQAEVEAEAIPIEKGLEIEEPISSPVVDLPDVDDQHKRILTWLWRKRR